MNTTTTETYIIHNNKVYNTNKLPEDLTESFYKPYSSRQEAEYVLQYGEQE